MVELLTVLGILGVMIAIAVPTYAAARKNVVLNGTTNEVLDGLRLAQHRSVASQQVGGAVQHGVVFASDRYTLFGGDVATPAYTEEHLLPSGIEICAGAGDSRLFEHLTGTVIGGAFELRVGTDSCATFRTVTVDASGRMTAQ